MDYLFFNVNDGYLEGIVRGYKSAILNQTLYLNLTQCETLDGNFEEPNIISSFLGFRSSV